jgi:hypothetical protein
MSVTQRRLTSKPTCPVCHQIIDWYTQYTGARPPAPGDLSVCFECSTPLQFTEALELELLPPTRVLLLSRETVHELYLAVKATREVRQLKRGTN